MRRALGRRTALVGLGGLAGAHLLGCSSEVGPPPPRVAPTPVVHTLELRMHQLINRDRAANGKPPLTYDERLADVARGHAVDMHTNKFFAHDSPTTGSIDDRLARARVSVATARENLAEAVDVDAAEASLLKSPGHFANLVADDVTHVGVGIFDGGISGPNTMLFVQVFGKVVVQESPADAKAVVLAKITEGRKARGTGAPRIDPVLEDLAERYVRDLDDRMEKPTLDSAGAQIIQALAKNGSQNASVLVSGQRMVAASEYTPTESLLGKPNAAIGIGAAPAKDDKGRPAVKVLVLMYA